MRNCKNFYNQFNDTALCPEEKGPTVSRE